MQSEIIQVPRLVFKKETVYDTRTINKPVVTMQVRPCCCLCISARDEQPCYNERPTVLNRTSRPPEPLPPHHPPQPKVVQKPNLVLSTTIGKGTHFLPHVNANIKTTSDVSGGPTRLPACFAWLTLPPEPLSTTQHSSDSQ
jgi:hypothetical protein